MLSERVQRQIDRLLDEAERATARIGPESARALSTRWPSIPTTPTPRPSSPPPTSDLVLPQLPASQRPRVGAFN